MGSLLKLNIGAETLEPEAMREAKQEDVKINRDRAIKSSR